MLHVRKELKSLNEPQRDFSIEKAAIIREAKAPYIKQDCFAWWGFPGASDGKESSCNARDVGSTPGLGRSTEKGMATHSSILVWRIPWTEESGGLQSTGLQRVGYD